MKPVDQIVLSGPESDCLRACVASILEMALEEVPNFAEEEDWVGALDRFLQPLGLQHIPLDAGDAGKVANDWAPGGYYIAVGRTVRERYHAVVAHQGQVVHDPYPTRQGLKVEEYHIFFLATLERGGEPRSDVGVGWLARVLQEESRERTRG